MPCGAFGNAQCMHVIVHTSLCGSSASGTLDVCGWLVLFERMSHWPSAVGLSCAYLCTLAPLCYCCACDTRHPQHAVLCCMRAAGALSSSLGCQTAWGLFACIGMHAAWAGHSRSALQVSDAVTECGLLCHSVVLGCLGASSSDPRACHL
jgi:hypothetical protein